MFRLLLAALGTVLLVGCALIALSQVPATVRPSDLRGVPAAVTVPAGPTVVAFMWLASVNEAGDVSFVHRDAMTDAFEKECERAGGEAWAFRAPIRKYNLDGRQLFMAGVDWVCVIN